MAQRPWTILAGASLAGVLCVCSLVAPAADKVSWDPARTSAPANVEELKGLQEAVKSVVDKTTPATVGIWILNAQGFRQGAGSGVIVSPDGLILTAAHVIAPAGGTRRRGATPDEEPERFVAIELYDGTKVKGKVLGRNPRVDSGMVQIIDKVPQSAKWPGAKNGKWPYAEAVDSSNVQVGQWVITLGHPGGPKTDRRAPVRVGQIQKAYHDLKVFVSDCTLVGGDSGGPLFDLTGKVIGIHSRIGLTIDNNVHIPTQAFKQEWDKLLAGKVIRGKAFMGVVLNRQDKEEPRIVRLDDSDSPASKAGLKAGDLILKINGEGVETSDDVDNIVQASVPGDKLQLEIQRGEEVIEITVTLGRYVER